MFRSSDSLAPPNCGPGCDQIVDLGKWQLVIEWSIQSDILVSSWKPGRQSGVRSSEQIVGWRAQVRRAMTAPGQPGETDLLLYFYLHSLCYHLVAPGLVTGSYWCAHFKWQPWDKSSPPLTTLHYPHYPLLTHVHILLAELLTSLTTRLPFIPHLKRGIPTTSIQTLSPKTAIHILHSLVTRGCSHIMLGWVGGFMLTFADKGWVQLL